MLFKKEVVDNSLKRIKKENDDRLRQQPSF